MTKEELQIKLGSRIVQLRTAKRIKQIELARKVDIEDSALRRIERGKTNCTLWMMKRISEALDIALPELLNFED